MSENYELKMFNERAAKLARVRSAIDEEMKALQEDAYRMGQESCVFYVTIADLLRANVENERLSDREFREFVGRLLEG